MTVEIDRDFPARAGSPQELEEDERGALTTQTSAPPSEAAHDGPVRKGVCNRTIVCGLLARAPECALTVRAASPARAFI